MVLNFVECVLMVVSLKELKFLLNYIYLYMNDIFKKKMIFICISMCKWIIDNLKVVKIW